MSDAGDREGRAREWIRALAGIPERTAGTAGEREAADRVAEWMREIGAAAVSVVPVASRPQTGLVLALHGGLAVVGCLWGGIVGVALAIAAAWSFHGDFRRRRPVLSNLLPVSDSLNVVGRIGAEAPARRVVLSAHIDTAQAGFLFRRALADFFARTAVRTDGSPKGPLAVPQALIVAGAVVAFAAWLGAHGFVFGLLRVVVVAGLLVLCLAGLQWAASPAAPGANDNASAVAAMLLCAEALRPRLPADVELWLVGTGAEEVGCVGMHAFVRSHQDWPLEDTYFVNFECLGGGALHYIRSEGVLARTAYPPALVELARRLAAGGSFGDVTATELLAATDGHAPAGRGYPTLSLISLEANGVPRNYHRLEDTVEGIDAAMVVRGADFGAAVAVAALRGEADPLPWPDVAAASA